MSQSHIASSALLFVLVSQVACTTTRTWEIDASSARGFQWNGRIRVVEQTTSEVGPLLVLQERTSAHSIELVGDNGRSVVVRPTGHASREHPIGRVETEDTPVIEQVLSMSFESEYPVLAKAYSASTQPAEVTSTTGPAQSGGHAERELEKELLRLLQHRQMLDGGEFGQLSCGEAIAAASTSSSYTVYALGEGRTLKAWIENTDPTLVRATLFDRDGKVIHEYEPTELPIREIEALRQDP